MEILAQGTELQVPFSVYAILGTLAAVLMSLVTLLSKVLERVFDKADEKKKNSQQQPQSTTECKAAEYKCPVKNDVREMKDVIMQGESVLDAAIREKVHGQTIVRLEKWTRKNAAYQAKTAKCAELQLTKEQQAALDDTSVFEAIIEKNIKNGGD